ncbi:ABC transporter substrate-binding protein [Petropleomorpha daqingensis]|uniref:Raffinose/stachyose/melibiose transport system substrate-binding protein n=1 Tax=Petropleomorpha daqingensis TaxID=2026353 RepID=A0A853CLK8_9ACTN|nr:extracellular solute-binding protein [Petropleomorpha daqingensis]NYJ08457.1 raffinose/stachyose/melibiose transport system substrate-binding protein [Petropleomorpha daqingensis]
MTYPHLRQNRRRAAAIAVPLVAGMLLAACGSGDSGSSGGKEPQTITFSYGPANAQDTAYEQLAKDYEASHPGVTIKVNKISAETYGQTLQTQMAAGNGPDVMQINSGAGQPGTVGTLAKPGLLLELTDSSFKSNVPEAELVGYDYKGNLYGVPSSTQIMSVIYNDELAKQNNVTIDASTNLDDVISQCGAVAATGSSIFALAGSVPANTGIMTVEIASSTVYGPDPDWDQKRTDGKTTFAKTKGWQQALQAVVDLNKAGCFQNGAAGAGFADLTNASSSGKAFGFFAPSGAAKSIMDAAGGHVTLVALGAPSPADKNYLTISSDIGLAGNAKTKSPKLVEDFIKFSISKEEAKKFADAQGTIPIGGNLDAADLLPQYQPVADQLTNKDYRTFAVDEWTNPEVYNALGTGVTGLLTGQTTVDEVLKNMDAAWDNG